jgi:gliding motility-associated-like protein
MVDSEIQDTFYVAEGEVVLISGPDEYDYYSWTPYVDLSNYTGPSTYFSGTASTQYTVNSSSINGCMRSDNIWIEVISLTVPTGFSPNGDFVNDEFVIPELINYDADVVIFNRWGDKVYESTNYKNDWDGTCKADFCLGEGLLPEGTYFYSIDIENVHFDGFTTIKR